MKDYEIANALKKLDLSTYPKEDILKLFRTPIEHPAIEMILPPKRIIVRGQLFDSKADYSNIKRHSYKPVEMNNTYQRASTPCHSMFYGCITDDIDAKHIAISEIMNITNKECLQESYVLSTWEVIEEIKLAGVIQSKEYRNPCSLIANIQEKYEQKFHDHLGYRFIECIASEFAKKGIVEDFKYLISALYAQTICDSGYDGVSYPSVPAQGKGINVANRK